MNKTIYKSVIVVSKVINLDFNCKIIEWYNNIQQDWQG